MKTKTTTTTRDLATHSLATMIGLAVCSTSLLGQDFTWTYTSAPAKAWESVASSADGTKLVATARNLSGGPDGIYTSNDSGLTWRQTSAPILYWWPVASSSDGTKLAAGVGGGRIYTSADAGLTWTQTSAPSKSWRSIASSSDGAKLVAAVYGSDGRIYTSADAGLTWRLTSAPNQWWLGVASSSDGTKLVAVSGVLTGNIFTSSDSGNTWHQTSAPYLDWYCVASSSDGAKLVAGAPGGGIYASTDSGNTWRQTSAPSNGQWVSAASSSDGTKLVALSDDTFRYIYTSLDSGFTWRQANVPYLPWGAAASSSDGTKLVAAAFGVGIYTAHLTAPPSIVSQPQDQTVLAGDSATFSVTASGTPPLSYQWQFAGADIPNATNSSFTIQSANTNDAGAYSVVVTNAYGSAASSAAILTVNPPPVCVTPPTGLVAWWPAGGNANDIAGDNNGTQLNGATFGPGKTGKAFSFDGVDALVQIPSSPKLSFGSNSPMTVELWAFRTGSAGVMHLIGKRNGCGGGSPPEINYQMALNMPSGEGLSFGSASGNMATSGLDMPMNTWTHLAGTFDGSNFCLYVNGLLVAAQPGTLGPQNTAPLLIGGSGDCAKFAGLIDEVSMYSRALAGAEIAAIYNAIHSVISNAV